MQITIDIPEPLYRELEEEAMNRHLSVPEIAALRLHAGGTPETNAGGHAVSLPLVQSGLPGTLDLSLNLNDAVFDDFDAA